MLYIVCRDLQDHDDTNLPLEEDNLYITVKLLSATVCRLQKDDERNKCLSSYSRKCHMHISMIVCK